MAVVDTTTTSGNLLGVVHEGARGSVDIVVDLRGDLRGDLDRGWGARDDVFRLREIRILRDEGALCRVEAWRYGSAVGGGAGPERGMGLAGVACVLVSSVYSHGQPAGVDVRCTTRQWREG